MKHMSDCKYLGYVLDVHCEDNTKCRRMATGGRKLAGATRSQVNIGVCHLSVQGSA